MTTSYRYTVFSSPVAGMEDEYNRWYTGQHLGDVLRVPGFVAAQRYRLAQPDVAAPAAYLAVYEIETDDIAATIAQLHARAGTAEMPIAAALDIGSVRAWIYEAISPRLVA